MKVLRPVIAVALCLALVGCPGQSTLIALTQVLGNAASSVASIQGNTTLATQLKTDTTAAVTAIQNWKTGTPTDMAIQALTIVEDDLNLFPQVGPYIPLIDLAIGTVESILALLPQPTVAPHALKQHRAVHLTQPAPKNAKEFKTQWNALAPPDAKIK